MFKEGPAVVDRVLNPVDNLSSLVTERGKAFARNLAIKLGELDYDYMNYLINGDYQYSPHPFGSRQVIDKEIALLTRVDQGGAPDFSDINMINFFLLGKEIQREDLAGLIGEHLLSEGLELGLIKLHDGDLVSLGGMFLFSKDLGNEFSYFLADWGGSEYASGKERVYASVESYILNYRLQEYSNLEGIVIEGGSGSGVQVITLLKKNEGLERGLALEASSRARNVSYFNAVLNGVEDRLEIYDDVVELISNMDEHNVSLAFTNPPFVASPQFARMPEVGTLDISGNFPLATYGGLDGLRTTGHFSKCLMPLLNNKGEMLIFSQFAMLDSIPKIVAHYMSKGNFYIRFEEFKSKEAKYDIEEWSSMLADLYHFENNLSSYDSANAVKEASMGSLAAQKITGFSQGFIVVKEVPRKDAGYEHVYSNSVYSLNPNIAGSGRNSALVFM